MTGVFAAVLVVALGYVGVLMLRMRHDWRREGQLRRSTAALTYPAYLLHLAALLIAALTRLWPMRTGTWPLAVAGGVIAIAGLAVSVAGMTRFGSVGQVSGNEPGGLVTSGIYRWTRNPQYVGWGTTLVGIALVSRSWAAVLAAIAYWGLIRLYLPLEESALERQFGSTYARYQRRTHRWFGRPASSRSAHA